MGNKGNCPKNYQRQLPPYHWRELPQVSFLSPQTRVCRDKTRLLSRQKYTCRDKTFVPTKLCLSKQNIFVATKLLSRQTRVCRDKHTFVATKDVPPTTFQPSIHPPKLVRCDPAFDHAFMDSVSRLSYWQFIFVSAGDWEVGGWGGVGRLAVRCGAGSLPMHD